MAEIFRTSISMSKATKDRLKQRQKETYPVHGLSFNAWMGRLLLQGAFPEERKAAKR